MSLLNKKFCKSKNNSYLCISNQKIMKKLLKEHGLNSDMGYYELIVNAIVNGYPNVSAELFWAMPRINRKAFVKAAITNWESGLTKVQIANLVELI